MLTDEGLKQQACTSQSGGREPRSRCWPAQLLVTPLPVFRWQPAPCPCMLERGTVSFLASLLTRVLIPSWGPHPRPHLITLATFQRPRLLTPRGQGCSTCVGVAVSSRPRRGLWAWLTSGSRTPAAASLPLLPHQPCVILGSAQPEPLQTGHGWGPPQSAGAGSPTPAVITEVTDGS